jgi:hypothetical protein
VSFKAITDRGKPNLLITADKILLRTIAILQFFWCVLMLAMTPVLFNYGGAAAHPGRFQAYLLFFLCGLPCSFSLFAGGFISRIADALWLYVLSFTLIWLMPNPDPTMQFAGRPPVETPVEWGWILLMIASVAMAGYLTVTAIRKFRQRCQTAGSP